MDARWPSIKRNAERISVLHIWSQKPIFMYTQFDCVHQLAVLSGIRVMCAMLILLSNLFHFIRKSMKFFRCRFFIRHGRSIHPISETIEHIWPTRKAFLVCLCVERVCVFGPEHFCHTARKKSLPKKKKKKWPMILECLTRNSNWKNNWCEWIEVTSFTNPFGCQSKTIEKHEVHIQLWAPSFCLFLSPTFSRRSVSHSLLYIIRVLFLSLPRSVYLWFPDDQSRKRSLPIWFAWLLPQCNGNL